jgi:hypothetical protein
MRRRHQARDTQTLTAGAAAAPTQTVTSIVLIFVPSETTRAEFEDALQKHIVSAESFANSASEKCAPAEDAEQLPLWRWFSF